MIFGQAESHCLRHAASDEAIKHVAQILMDLSPDGAIIARLGGDEFAILARWTSLAEIRGLAESASARSNDRRAAIKEL